MVANRCRPRDGIEISFVKRHFRKPDEQAFAIQRNPMAPSSDTRSSAVCLPVNSRAVSVDVYPDTELAADAGRHDRLEAST